jgi:hypothetical protein
MSNKKKKMRFGAIKANNNPVSEGIGEGAHKGRIRIDRRDPAWIFLFILIAVGMLLIYQMLPHGFAANILSSAPDPLMKLTLEAQEDKLTHLDQESTTKQSNVYFIDTVNFPDGQTFKHSKLRDIDYSQNFFTTIEGEFDALAAGEYTFIVASDDGFRLTINKTVVSEFTNDRPMSETEGKIPLEEGRHTFSIRHFQGFGGVGLQAWYIGPPGDGDRCFMGQSSPWLQFIPRHDAPNQNSKSE